MTIVIARRRNDEILLLADTMVTDANLTGPDVIPGRLKIVTIGSRITVAFAGNADAAFLALRTARREFHRSGSKSAINVLKEASSDGTTDFIVAIHRPETFLLRVRKGVTLEISDICALGDDEPFVSLIEEARNSVDTGPLRKSELRLKFVYRLMTNKDLGSSVGGFPISVEALPTAHRYLGITGTYTYKFPALKWGEETHQPIEQVYSGDGHFMFSIVPSQISDVPVVGACLLQARQGYVFSPLEEPHAFRIDLLPENTEWEGKEQEMYKHLNDAISQHVHRINDTISADG